MTENSIYIPTPFLWFNSEGLQINIQRSIVSPPDQQIFHWIELPALDQKSLEYERRLKIMRRQRAEKLRQAEEEAKRKKEQEERERQERLRIGFSADPNISFAASSNEGFFGKIQVTASNSPRHSTSEKSQSSGGFEFQISGGNYRGSSRRRRSSDTDVVFDSSNRSNLQRDIFANSKSEESQPSRNDSNKKSSIFDT